MRVTFISPSLNMNGGSRVITIYANALARLGHTVRIISAPPNAISAIQKAKSWLKGEGWPASLPVKSFRIDSNVENRILNRSGPVTDDDVPDGDVVIATWWETAEWVNALHPSKGAKVYFIQHHEVFPYLPVDRCHATYRMRLHKIVVAQWLKRVMSSQYNDDVVDVVPNSVDREQFFAAVRGKQVSPTVGLIYSTTPFKGLDTALAALRAVYERMPNLRLISFGSQRTGSKLLLPKGAEFYFSPPQDQLRNFYSQCDVWLTASRSEGFNLPALEAMACRTPIVATRTGWPEEAVVSKLNGFLVDVDDINGLTRGIEWVLSLSDEKWKVLSANAYATAASGSWHQSAEMFEKALLHACDRAARGEIGTI